MNYDYECLENMYNMIIVGILTYGKCIGCMVFGSMIPCKIS